MTSPDSAPANPGQPCEICADPALVHWQRRLTDDEITVEKAKEQARRDQLTALADPQLPPPDFGPMPDMHDYTRAVYACLTHAIHGDNDAGARIHQNTCTAPNPADLPGCNCTPEPLPTADPDPAPVELPPGW